MFNGGTLLTGGRYKLLAGVRSFVNSIMHVCAQPLGDYVFAFMELFQYSTCSSTYTFITITRLNLRTDAHIDGLGRSASGTLQSLDHRY